MDNINYNCYENKKEFVKNSQIVEQCFSTNQNVFGSNTSLSESSEIFEPLANRLNQFRLKKIGCDVIFIVGDEEENIYAHKLILGCSTPVFQAMFYGMLSADSNSNNLNLNNNINQNNENYLKTKLNDSQKLKTDQNEIKNYKNIKKILKKNGKLKSSKEEYEIDEDKILFSSSEENYNNLLNVISPKTNNLNESKDKENNNNIFSTNNNTLLASEKMKLKENNCLNQNNPQLNNLFLSAQSTIDFSLSSSIDSKTLANNNNLFVNNNSIEMIYVPDILPIAFNILIDYIYNNFDVKTIELNDDNVMHTLYAAKKYDLHLLVLECVRYLLNGLLPCNSVCLLAQARFFQEETLLKQCYKVIDKNTDVALQANNIINIDRDTLIKILGRTELDPSSELIIFNAAQAWAEAECNRRQLKINTENVRLCLGPALELIRFPLMSVQEFGQAANCSVLNFEEITEVFLYLTVKPRPFCRYPTGFRSGSRSKHIINRFNGLSSKRCTRRESKICFTADRDIFVSALGIYGLAPMIKSHLIYDNETKTEQEWSRQVEIQLASVKDSFHYDLSISHSATNTVFLHGIIGDLSPCIAMFDSPVPCLANKTYVASIRFISETAIQTFAGKEGKESITLNLPFNDEKITFKFQSCHNSYGNDDGGKNEGQIPSLHFMVQWPQTTSANNT